MLCRAVPLQVITIAPEEKMGKDGELLKTLKKVADKFRGKVGGRHNGMSQLIGHCQRTCCATHPAPWTSFLPFFAVSAFPRCPQLVFVPSTLKAQEGQVVTLIRIPSHLHPPPCLLPAAGVCDQHPGGSGRAAHRAVLRPGRQRHRRAGAHRLLAGCHKRVFLESWGWGLVAWAPRLLTRRCGRPVHADAAASQKFNLRGS